LLWLILKRAGDRVMFVIAVLACSRQPTPQRSPYVPVSQLETKYGRLIAASNHPTTYQNGTGERVGLFQDREGTVWGLPLILATDGSVLGCAPQLLQDARVTDTFPAGTTIAGATNRPTGWRGGTGKLELLIRDSRGKIHWKEVAGGEIEAGPACWAKEVPGPPQQLHYYRLAPARTE
jgi:hypothetical protein